MFTPPYFVVPMPLDILGNGPEMDQTKVVRTVYQVWDSNNLTVEEFQTEATATLCVNMLNEIQRNRTGI